MKISFLPKIFFLAAAISWGQCVFAGPDANPGMWIARDQDSTTADFLEPSRAPLHFQNGQIPSDPLAEKNGLNLYGFVSNDPVDFIDPFGLREEKTTGAWYHYAGFLGATLHHIIRKGCLQTTRPVNLILITFTISCSAKNAKKQHLNRLNQDGHRPLKVKLSITIPVIAMAKLASLI